MARVITFWRLTITANQFDSCAAVRYQRRSDNISDGCGCLKLAGSLFDVVASAESVVYLADVVNKKQRRVRRDKLSKIPNVMQPKMILAHLGNFDKYNCSIIPQYIFN
jgi:hypothetical protein